MLARLLLVGALAAALAPAAEAQPAGTEPRKARCQLILTGAAGGGAANDTSAAAVLELSCRGAPLVAAANRTLLGLEPTATLPGVQWDKKDCGRSAARCLLTICGDTVAVFEGPVIQGLVMPPPPPLAPNAPATALPPTSLPALCVAGNAKVTLLGAVIAGNTNASALNVFENGTLALGRGSVVTGNQARAPPVSAYQNGALVVRNTTRFVNNSAGSPSDAATRGPYEGNCGGAMRISNNASAEIQGDVAIVGNTAGHGGGICISETARVVVANGTLMANNTAGGGGGAINIAGIADLVVSNASITNNNASFGGGLMVSSNCTVRVSGTSFIGNSAKESGGGVSVRASSTATFEDCVIADNTAEFDNGGGMEASAWPHVKLLQIRFVANDAPAGPDLWVGPGAEVQVLAGTNVGPSNATVTWAREGRCAVGEALPGGGCSRCAEAQMTPPDC